MHHRSWSSYEIHSITSPSLLSFYSHDCLMGLFIAPFFYSYFFFFICFSTLLCFSNNDSVPFTSKQPSALLDFECPLSHYSVQPRALLVFESLLSWSCSHMKKIYENVISSFTIHCAEKTAAIQKRKKKPPIRCH